MLNPKDLRPGEEDWEVYHSTVLGKELTQYDYRHTDGKLFSCVREDLEQCHIARDRWLAGFAVEFLNDSRKEKRMDFRDLWPGEEGWITYRNNENGKELVRYGYRHPDGKLFYCMRGTLKDCQLAKDRWLENNEEYTIQYIKEEDGSYFVYVEELPGCASMGDTIEEASEKIQEAIEGCIESNLARGLKIPEKRKK